MWKKKKRPPKLTLSNKKKIDRFKWFLLLKICFENLFDSPCESQGKSKKIYRQSNWTMSLKLTNWGHATKERVIINYELITVFELVSSILLGLWGQGGRVEVWAFKSLSRLNFEGWSMKWKFSNIRICSNLSL